MPLYWLKIEDYIAQHLSQLESFVMPKDTSVFSRSFLGEKETLHGLYINNDEDFVLITGQSIHRIKGEKARTIDYEAIREVDLPKDPDQRALYIHMRNGDTFLLPIANETEEYLDFYAVRKFLVSVIYCPHYSDNPEDIEKIQSREDLIEFLDNQNNGGLNRHLTFALTEGFPKSWQLDLFKIDRELLASPDLWRLLALFLSRPCEEPWFGFQGDPAGSRTTHDIIRAIEIGKPPDAT